MTPRTRVLRLTDADFKQCHLDVEVYKNLPDLAGVRLYGGRSSADHQSGHVFLTREQMLKLAQTLFDLATQP